MSRHTTQPLIFLLLPLLLLSTACTGTTCNQASEGSGGAHFQKG